MREPVLSTGYEVLLPTAELGSGGLGDYLRRGGYQQLNQLRGNRFVDGALSAIEASGLVGRGGTGFPTGPKLQAVRRQNATAKYLVCSGDEGGPGTSKDLPILKRTPHRVLEGMAVCGMLIGAETGILYLGRELAQSRSVLDQALREARHAGQLGGKTGKAGFSFDIRLVWEDQREGCDQYDSGLHPTPVWSVQARPRPSQEGLFHQPTAVLNVETVAFIPLILERGAAWFRHLGRGDAAGTKLYSVSGRVRRPGLYELPLGATARELIHHWGGGLHTGRQLKAFTLGGLVGGLHGPELMDLPLDYDAPRSRGAALGSGALVALDDSCCAVDFVHSCLLALEKRSCGRCIPCRIGTVRLRQVFDSLTGRAAPLPPCPTGLREISQVMELTSACGLGRAAPNLIRGLLQSFAQETAEHHTRQECRTGVCPFSSS